MKVAMLTAYWPTKRNPISGLFVQQQAEALRAAGIEVHIIYPKRPFSSPNAPSDFVVSSPKVAVFPSERGFVKYCHQINTRLVGRGAFNVVSRTGIEGYSLVHIQGLQNVAAVAP